MPLPTITALPTPPSRSDNPALFNSRADSFLGAFPGLVTELNLYGAALAATITSTDFAATSTTSLTVGTGAKSLTIQTGKHFQIGQPVRIANTAAPANYMDGQVTAYNSGTGALDVNVTDDGGTGTLAAWTISLLPGGGGSFVTLTGIETLTNKTLTTPVLSGTASGTAAGRLGYDGGALSFGDGTVQRVVVTLNNAQTLTNKTIALASNAVSGTLAEFNAACSDGDFVSVAGAETLTNKTLTAPAINNGTITGVTLISATIRADCALNDTGTIAAASPGFRGIPASTQSPGSGITLALADAGKMVPNTTGGWTIPANASIAFPIGTAIELYNNSSSSQTVAITSDTLRLAGTASTGSRTIAQRGLAVIVKVAATEWAISGAGVS
jgi:hypothetical protein